MAGERILLVEDSVDVRHFLADVVLQSAGYDVLTAADGAEGFTLAHDLLPDLVVADHLMPKRTGLEMLSDLHAAEIDLPFILITAEGSEKLAVQALRLGVSDYLIKPFDPHDLLQAIERVLREHWTRQITRQIPDQLLDTNRQLEQRLHTLDTLVEIGKRVTSQLDLQSVLDRVVETAVSVAHAEEGSLLLVDEPSGELYLYASTAGLGADSFRLPVADSLAGQVVRTGKPLVITGEDLHKIKTHYLVHDLVYVPLALQDRVIGVLGVANRETNREFELYTLQLLNVLADFSAIAIDNAQLYATTEHERDTLNTILRDTEDAIIAVDRQDRLLFCNPAACRTFNVNRSDWQGYPLAEVIQHQELIELFARETCAERNCSSEIVLDEGKHILNAQLTWVEQVGKVAVMQDITHFKELDRIKSDFVTMVSHDLRSPLTAILGYVELLDRNGPLNDHQRQFAERIIFSVRSITALISDLLELGKIEAGFDQDREPTSFSLIVRYAIEEQRHEWEAKQHTLTINLPDGLPSVLGNPQRLRQMVNNLLENAIKYTPPQGEIRVALGAQNDFLVLHISDTGIGIAQKDQPYIFDKFYRGDQAIEQYEGTGLGLSIVKGIVDQHQGRIWVESQIGKGSTFTVMLPSYR